MELIFVGLKQIDISPAKMGLLRISKELQFRICYHGAAVCVLSRFICVRLSVTPWTVVCQDSLSMGFSRQDYWSGLPCPPPGDLPDPRIKPVSLMSPALADRFFSQHHLGSPAMALATNSSSQGKERRVLFIYLFSSAVSSSLWDLSSLAK